LSNGGLEAKETKGERTRRRLLEAAEQVFADLGYHDASIVKITEAAGVSQGTFYLYFSSKQEVFDVLVEDLNSRVRHAMSEASVKGSTRLEKERLGFQAFFRFTADHPALYRVIRQAEFASPRMLRLHYERLAEGYVTGLRQASDQGEITTGDPIVTAWALMAVGEMIGLRWILWGDTREVPPEVFDETMAFVARALGVSLEDEDGRG
jgi:AcrR family transcriptional regulator